MTDKEKKLLTTIHAIKATHGERTELERKYAAQFLIPGIPGRSILRGKYRHHAGA